MTGAADLAPAGGAGRPASRHARPDAMSAQVHVGLDRHVGQPAVAQVVAALADQLVGLVLVRREVGPVDGEDWSRVCPPTRSADRP